jgi:hypothetical protein
MRTYAELGIPERLLEAVVHATKKTRESFVLMLPLLWLAAADGAMNSSTLHLRRRA